jgi:hypothetical protein
MSRWGEMDVMIIDEDVRVRDSDKGVIRNSRVEVFSRGKFWFSPQILR